MNPVAIYRTKPESETVTRIGPHKTANKAREIPPGCKVFLSRIENGYGRLSRVQEPGMYADDLCYNGSWIRLKDMKHIWTKGKIPTLRYA